MGENAYAPRNWESGGVTLKKSAKWMGALLLAAAFVAACAAPYVWQTGGTDEETAAEDEQESSADDEDAAADDDGTDDDVVDADDYDTTAEFVMAIAKSMEPETDVPEEWVNDGVHEDDYKAGTLKISFEGDVKKAMAKKLVRSYGGTWVDGTFNTGLDVGFNRATAYFEEYADATYAELDELADRIEEEEGVRSAGPVTNATASVSGASDM